MPVGEYRIVWTTPGGGTGYSVLHMIAPLNQTAANQIAARVHTFISTLLSYMPNEVSAIGDSELRVLNQFTGELEGVFAVATGAGGVGSDNAAYNRAAGARIDWQTGIVVAGRRIQGRTYVVPLGTGAFDSNGLVSAPGIAALAAAGNALRTGLQTDGGNLVVWSRTTGATAPVTGVTIPPKGAILRGRRD